MTFLEAARLTEDGAREYEDVLRVVIEERHTSWGSVTGRLERIYVHGKIEMSICPLIQPRVNCVIHDDLMYTVKEALGRRVVVSGVLTYPARSYFPSDVVASGIEILPNDDELPSLIDLRGSMPDIGNGLPSEEYLRKLRKRDE